MSDTAGHAISRRGARSLVALFAVLTALLHVLGCAHGPASSASSAPPRYAPAPVVLIACTGRAAHGAASCTDVDEPSVLTQRTDESAVPPAAHGTTAEDAVVRNPVALPARSGRYGAGAGAGRGTDHRRRAALGVWRN
ncbi:hypothetical protein ACFVWX_33750 [Streptomyces sp. NPDC058220]|uniref:hypothetical protein n=1 Tax=unclassified Streptomyces TaxID=2593676 RepID=UPI00365EF5C7